MLSSQPNTQLAGTSHAVDAADENMERHGREAADTSEAQA